MCENYTQISSNMSSLQSFVDNWFNHEEWWFSKEPAYDLHITDTYQHLLDETDNQLIEQSIIGTIIVWDQLPRHVFRGQQANHIILYYLHKACQVVCEQDVLYNNSFIDSLSTKEFIFFWLPYRHTKEYQHIRIVMDEAWKRLNRIPPEHKDFNYIKKFIRATYTNCPKEDQTFMIEHYGKSINTQHDFEDILDYDGKHARVKENVCLSISTSPFLGESWLIVSLSGGVDSMVSLYYMKKAFPKTHITAVHINYDNRIECHKEVSFLKQWCDSIKVPLVVRKIGELHRKDCMDIGLRSLYESYTKDVRFGTYKTVWSGDSGHSMSTKPIVVLGHNRDDCFENCLTNATYKSKYDNLHGMSIWSQQDGICFWRPLIKTPKALIIKYAHKHQIPYLKDSTVSWSQRGQIRDVIVPALINWNAKAIDGLLDLGDVLSELFDILKQSSNDWCSDMTTRNETSNHDGYHIMQKVSRSIPTSQLFWKDVFMKVFKTCVSNKSMTNFLSRINAFNNSVCNANYKEINVKHKVVLKKGFILYYSMLKNRTYLFEFVIQAQADKFKK